MSDLSFCAIAYPASDELDALLTQRMTDRESFYRQHFPGERLVRVVVGSHHIVFVELKGTSDPTLHARYMWQRDGYALTESLWNVPRVPEGSAIVLHSLHSDDLHTEVHEDHGCVQLSSFESRTGRTVMVRDETGHLAEEAFTLHEGVTPPQEFDIARELGRVGLTPQDFAHAHALRDSGVFLYSSGTLAAKEWTRDKLREIATQDVYRDAETSDPCLWPVDAQGRVRCQWSEEAIAQHLDTDVPEHIQAWREAYVEVATIERADALDM